MNKDSKRILCPYCGQYVNEALFYTLHYYKVCIMPLPLDYEDP